MGDSCMAEANSRATGSEIRIYPDCLFWDFVAHSLWRVTLLSPDIVGRALVLPQNNVLDFVESPWEALLSLRSGWWVEWGEGGGKERRGGNGNWDLYVK